MYKSNYYKREQYIYLKLKKILMIETVSHYINLNRQEIRWTLDIFSVDLPLKQTHETSI